MENDPGTFGEHPLIRAGLPDWLAQVDIQVAESAPIDIGGGKFMAAAHLMTAMTVEVGVACVSMTIAPELAQLFSEFTENPAWKRLPTEPSIATRVTENSWEIRVGDHEATFDRETLAAKLATALGDSPE